MKVTVDLSAVAELSKDATASLRRRQPREMQRILRRAAAEDRRSHAYKNQTGDAERSTQASEIQQDGDVVSAELGMGVDYAIYLDTRGLTRIADLAEGAAEELEFYFDGEAERIAGR